MASYTPESQASLYYPDNTAHLRDELRLLDLRIQRHIAICRAQHRRLEGLSPNHGVFISDQQVDALLQRGDDAPTCSDTASLDADIKVLRTRIEERVTHSSRSGVFLTLPALSRCLGLLPLETQAVVMCLAAELDRKYDTLYAYLQDDVTRKKPSPDLILNLLCDSEGERWRARPLLSDQGALFRTRILEPRDDPASPAGSSGLARFVQLDPRILNYLLGDNGLDTRLDGCAEILYPSQSMDDVVADPGVKTQLSGYIRRLFLDDPHHNQTAVIYLHGPYGIGKRQVALGACHELNCPLLCVDMEMLAAQQPELTTGLQLVLRESLLFQAALYVDNLDPIMETETGKSALRILARLMREYGWLVLLAGERAWPHRRLFGAMHFDVFHFPPASLALRQTAWQRALAHVDQGLTPLAAELARRLNLSPGQIQDAVDLARQRQLRQDSSHSVSTDELHAAARRQSHHQLDTLSVRIEPRHHWPDLVLPTKQIRQLKEICAQLRHHHRVFDEWGFEQKYSYGKGLSALFVGPSGTGKTMAAEVISNELGLDLHKIDLSGVVSKYIGETEKNLSRIFEQAQSSNTILFFDEADALFGKRTRVSDAHDRYANIETSFLLQRMEAYEGIVILATNLRDNLDEAFTRRIRFLVEFPFPDPACRETIWRTHLPPEAPVDGDLDFARLASLQLTGGNIKNIVLNAAFLAADRNRDINETDLLEAAQGEFEKSGRIWNEPSAEPE